MADDGLPTPVMIALISAFSGLFGVFILCAIVYLIVYHKHTRILLGSHEAGAYDDEQAFLAQEDEALETMDDVSRTMYIQARAFQAANPPNSIQTDISLSQYMAIQEKGVSAWEFEPDFENGCNCFVEARTEISFYEAVTSVQTNLPVPKNNVTYYWEAKLYEKPSSTLVSIGMATKPYPCFRLPGYHKYSVAYDSLGQKRYNQPFSPTPNYGPPLQQGDVVGVGYKPRSNSIFFTRNGKKLDEAAKSLKYNLFPTIGSNGQCIIHVNFGQSGFVFVEANVKRWGLAPPQGSLAPPPPYGSEQGSILLQSNTPLSTSQSNSLINQTSLNRLSQSEREEEIRTHAIRLNDITHSYRHSPPISIEQEDNNKSSENRNTIINKNSTNSQISSQPQSSSMLSSSPPLESSSAAKNRSPGHIVTYPPPRYSSIDESVNKSIKRLDNSQSALPESRVIPDSPPPSFEFAAAQSTSQDEPIISQTPSIIESSSTSQSQNETSQKQPKKIHSRSRKKWDKNTKQINVQTNDQNDDQNDDHTNEQMYEQSTEDDYEQSSGQQDEQNNEQIDNRVDQQPTDQTVGQLADPIVKHTNDQTEIASTQDDPVDNALGNTNIQDDILKSKNLELTNSENNKNNE